ncbi:hypothetical protein DFH27DRAFT_652063 [Peziza echinospora]|nr:hypothetical protein DFH27DRAFT_652063 [Peziza echinospora]
MAASTVSLSSARTAAQGDDHYARINNLVQDLDETVKRCFQLREEIHRMRMLGYSAAAGNILPELSFITDHHTLTPPGSIYGPANTTGRDSTVSPTEPTPNTGLPESSLDEDALESVREVNPEDREHDGDGTPVPHGYDDGSVYSQDESDSSSDTSDGTEVGEVILDSIAAANDPYERNTSADAHASRASGFSRRLNVKGSMHKIGKILAWWRK